MGEEIKCIYCEKDISNSNVHDCLLPSLSWSDALMKIMELNKGISSLKERLREADLWKDAYRELAFETAKSIHIYDLDNRARRIVEERKKSEIK